MTSLIYLSGKLKTAESKNGNLLLKIKTSHPPQGMSRLINQETEVFIQPVNWQEVLEAKKKGGGYGRNR